ncbi:hypothetical protein [Kibdelosporangium phytohabitans]|uniref:Lipoprotein LpqE n=1 Tax=Kibdelosporangium phytohabitans TaxID=860235 RepID=A0A0N9HS36_9PSEU|nr:hypothetical protein [Kibdelosporangium phytohabitans]ALG05926.1 hypothetical protein AOZ06_02425 [Kibdelosporangium phytohabitans]MBE1466025.1 copper(I)-binding protein [Kibdelosporangium phytohabitans]
MSRQRHSLRFATAAVGVALALAGCSAGQISQTAGMEPAVNGGGGNVGLVAVRDVQFAYPDHGVYEKGASAALTGTLVNSAQSDDELVSVTTPVGQARITGDKKLAAGRSLILEVPAGGVSSSPSASSSSAPTTTTGAPSGSATSGAPSGAATSGAASGTATTTSRPATTSSKAIEIGKATIVLSGLTEEIRSGKSFEITFTFKSGSVTILVPVAVPTTPRTPAGGGGGH